MIIISVFLPNICFGCVKKTSQLDVSFYAPKTYVIKDMNRSCSLNPVCPKFISNWRVFRKIGVRIFEFYCISVGTYRISVKAFFKHAYVAPDAYNLV